MWELYRVFLIDTMNTFMFGRDIFIKEFYRFNVDHIFGTDLFERKIVSLSRNEKSSWIFVANVNYYNIKMAQLLSTEHILVYKSIFVQAVNVGKIKYQMHIILCLWFFKMYNKVIERKWNVFKLHKLYNIKIWFYWPLWYFSI